MSSQTNQWRHILICGLFTIILTVSASAQTMKLISRQQSAPLLAANNISHTLYRLDTENGQTLTPILNNCSTRNLSFFQQKIGTKKFVTQPNGELLQIPIILDLNTGIITNLLPATETAGMPSFAADGTIAVTQGTTLLILSADGVLKQQFDLPIFVNLAVISPDGKKVVYNDAEDQLWLLDTKSGSRTLLTENNSGYFAPIWAPDNGHLAASTLTGDLVLWDVNTGSPVQLGPADSPIWSADSKNLYFRQIKRDNRLEIISAEIVTFSLTNEDVNPLTNTPDKIETAFYLNETKNEFFIQTGTHISITLRDQIHTGTIKEIFEMPEPAAPEFQLQSEGVTQAPQNVVAFQAPYVHQVYDTPDWFNGHWACGATAATMGLAYFDILPKWPVTVSSPYRHTSYYGRYICEKYWFNGYNYAIGGKDPNDTMGYGGYGFIIRNNWQDTKGYMAQYLTQHGLNSSVDWSPSFAKAQGETNRDAPFVLLNSLTTSGHYILIIGYHSDKRVLVANDPYGDRNRASYPNNYGKTVYYDWPGYDNGYANLNTVWCFIYMRAAAADLRVSEFTVPDSANLGDTLSVNSALFNHSAIDADAFHFGMYLSENTTIPTTEPIWEDSTAGLVHNDTLPLTFDVVLPDSVVSDEHYLILYADNANEIDEMSDNNNTYSQAIVIRGYPRIYAFSPQPDAELTSQTPRIVAKIIDNVVGVDESSIYYELDGVDISSAAKRTTTSLSYSPPAPLSPGVHHVLVEANNLDGRKTHLEWSFTITGGTGVLDADNELLLKQTKLEQNYPNPFNMHTRITYSLAKSALVSVQVFDLNGRLVKTICNQRQSAGAHTLVWDGMNAEQRAMTSGVYFYRLKTDNITQTRRMLLIK